MARYGIIPTARESALRKIFITAEELLVDSYRLAVKVFESGYRPDFIVGIWRGGGPVGIAVQECFEYLGVRTDHIAVRTSYAGMDSYSEMVADNGAIRVHGLQYLLENLNADHSLLIVDDVVSSGRSMAAVRGELARKSRANMPEDVRVAAPWYKPAQNKTGHIPDYFLRETDDWLVMPYELNGLDPAEIAANKPGLAPILERLRHVLKKGDRGDGPEAAHS